MFRIFYSMGKNSTYFGKWDVPTSWDDVTLAQLIEIDRERATEQPSLTKVVAILCGKPVEAVEQLPVEFVESILSRMGFIKEQPDVKPSCSIVVDGETYSVDVREKLKFGEWVAFNAIQQSEPDNVAKILAVVCRKDGEVYDSQFENEVFESRVRMFESVPCVDALNVVAFFLMLWRISDSSSLQSLKEAAISYIAMITGGSTSDGDGSASLTGWQKRKLRKLSDYIRRTY